MPVEIDPKIRANAAGMTRWDLHGMTLGTSARVYVTAATVRADRSAGPRGRWL